MATIKGQYQAAIDNGLLDPSVTEDQFVSILEDPDKRKRYFDLSNEIIPGAYGEYSTFDKGVSNALADYRNPNAGSLTPAPTNVAGQIPISQEDRNREEQIRNIDTTLSKVGVERLGNRMPIGDEREDVLQQQKQLEQERATLQGQRKSYMTEPKDMQEAADNWVLAWMDNTDEGKRAKEEMDNTFRTIKDNTWAAFEKTQAYKDIVGKFNEEQKELFRLAEQDALQSDEYKHAYEEISRKFHAGELTQEQANKQLSDEVQNIFYNLVNTRYPFTEKEKIANQALNDAFYAANGNFLQAEYNKLYNDLWQRAIDADNGYLAQQEERIKAQAAKDAANPAIAYANRAREEARQKTQQGLSVEDLVARRNNGGVSVKDQYSSLSPSEQQQMRDQFTQTASNLRNEYAQEVYDRRYLNQDGTPKDRFISDAGSALMAGIGRVARLPFSVLKAADEFAMGIEAKIMGKTAGVDYAKNSWISEAVDFLGDEYMQSRIEHYAKEANRYQDGKGVITSAIEGDYGKAIGKAVLGAIESVPNLAVSIYTGKLGASKLGGTLLGASAALSKWEELSDRTDLSIGQKAMSAFGAFVAESVPEIIGAARYGKMLNKKPLQDVKKEVLKETISNWDKFLNSKTMRGAGKAYDFLMEWFGEGITEGMTETANLIIDKSLGIKKEITQEDWRSIGDAFLIGQISDMPVKGVSLLNQSLNKKALKEQISQDQRLLNYANQHNIDVDRLATIANKVQFGEEVSKEDQKIFDGMIDVLAKSTKIRLRIQDIAAENNTEDIRSVMSSLSMVATLKDMSQDELFELLSKETDEMTDSEQAQLSEIKELTASLYEQLNTPQMQEYRNEIEEAQKRISGIMHKKSGNVYRVQMKGLQDKAGYIVSGDLSVSDSGVLSGDVVTVKLDNGEVWQGSARDFDLLDQPQPAAQLMDIERARLTAKMHNKDRFKVGDVVYLTENGQPIDGNSSRVVNVTEDGVEVEMVDPNGQPNTTVIPHEVAEGSLSSSNELASEGDERMMLQMPDGSILPLQKTTSGEWMTVNENGENARLLTNDVINELITSGRAKIVNGEQAPSLEVASGNGVVSEETGEIEQPIEQPQAAAPVPSKYPTTQEGKLDWGQMDVPTATEAAIEKFGDKNTAKEYAELQIAQAKKAVAAANKKKATSTDADEFVAQKNAIRQEQQAAQAELSKWENILLGIANYKTEAEQAEADAAAQRAAEQRAQRKQTIEGVGGGSMAERLAASPRIDGNAGSITAADGTKIPGHYVLVSANALTPSHNPNANFAPSEGYPTVDGQSINDRDYQADREEQAKVQQVAQTYDGRAITNMPIVSDEGLVYSGNGRTMAGQLAAANGTDGAYIEALKENATQFGFTAEQVDEVPNARVVFMTDERLPYNTSTLALFNMTEQQTQSNTAAAAANVRKLTPEAVGHIIAAVQEFDTVDAFFTNNKAPFELVNQLIADGIISERDKAAFVDNGLLTATGKDRLTALLFGTAFDEKTIRLLGSNAKVRNSVMRALPQILENKGLGDFSLFEHINNAIQAIYDMDTNKMSFFEFTRQIDIEGKTASDKYSAFELLLVDEMVNGGVQSFRDVLNGYNARAKESAGGQMDLFTGETLTTEALTTQILEQYEQRETNERGGAQSESAGAGTQESDGKTITDSAASEIIEQITAEAEEFETIELTPSNWVKLFGEDGLVDTPIGKVKMGEGQFLKLMQKGRDTKLGMIKPTLERPSVIIEDKSKAKEGQETEREFSYVFVKAFTNPSGERLYYFTSVTVQKDSQEVVISNQEKERSRIMRLLKDGKLAYINKATLPLDTDTSIQGDQLTNPVGGVSADKGTKNVPSTKENVQKTAEEQQKNADLGEKTQTDTKKAQEDEQKSVRTEQKSVEQNEKTQEVGEISETVDELDAKLAAAESETDTNPTEAQKKAENYKQGHVTLWGLPFTIENPKGSVRRGTDAKGKQWEQVMNNTYGKIRRTEGVDGDHIDVFFGPNLHSEKVFVVDQRNVDTGEFDEHKVMLGFDSMQEAQDAYLSNYEEGWQGMGPVTETTMDEFKKWIESSHRKTKPFSEYKSVKKEGGESAPYTNVASKEGAVNESELQNLAQTLGAKGLHIVSSKEELPKEEKAAYRAIENGVKVTGWYNPKTNQAYIYAPNANNTREVYLTLLHEFVAHKGLRDMLGKEKFDKLCRDVWNMMSEQDKLAYAVYVKQQVNVNSDKMQEIIAAMTEEQKEQLLNDTNVQLEAADEYMAHFAETGVSEQERSIWQRIVDAVKDLLRKIGINIPLSDADIARMLYESNRRFSSNMTMKEVAQRIAKNNGVYENLSANAKNMGLSDNVRFRISEEQDKAYAAAVERGDIAAAEEILRKAAAEAGYLPPSDYQDAHGAPRASVEKEDFTNAEAMQEAADNGEDTNLWAVAQGISIQPDDYFSPQGPRWYGYSNQSGMESYAALSSAIRSINSQLNEYGEVKDMPIVKVYRTVPTNIVGEQLESEGQWVTPSLEYAIRHGENRFDGNYRIIEQEVPADQLWWDGMDPREWGFDDGTNNVYQNTKNNRKLFEVTYDQDGNLIPLSQRFDTENEDIRFRVGTEVVEMGDNTLVGLHNISTAKLRKAIKQGGLANPSVAVINMAIQDHEQYGDITLVMPSSMIDSTTGRNAGTYTGDIWSPTYPYVERKMSSKGSEKYYDALNKAFEGKHSGVKSRTAVIFVNMLDNQGNPDNLAYWYMLEKGIAPTDVIINSGISDDIKQRFEPLIDKRFASDLTTEERDLLLGIAAELEGKTTEELLQAAQEAKKRYEDTVLANEKASQFSKNIALSAIDEIDTYGVRLNVLSDTMRRVREAIDKDGGVDVNATISAAVDYVQENGLKGDFDAWLDNLDDRFDIEEVIFDGYTRDGDRKYVKNTIANASRLMNQQPIQNATSHGGLSATRGQLVERMSTLAQIRANKHRLAAINEYEDEQWKAMQDEWFNEIINPLSEMQKIDDNTFINMDIAEQRLLEAIMEKDPIAYLNREYRYKIEKDSKFAKALKDLMGRLKALPSKYFETKFKRPVMLNEFVSAVVPQDLPQDLKDSLKEAGLDVYEYNDTEGSRREATIEATNGEGVRFRIGDDHLSVEENANLIENNLHNSEKNSTFVAEMEKLLEIDTVSAQEVKQFIDKVRNGRKEKTLQMGRLRMDGTSRGNDLYWCGAVIGEAVVLHQEKSGVSSQSSLLGSNLFIEVAKQLNAFTDYNEFVKGLGVPIGQGQEAIVWVKDDDGDVVKALHYNALLRDNTQQVPAIIERISWFNHLFPENQLSLNQVLGLHNNNLYVEVTQGYVDGEHPNFEDWGEVGAFINQMQAKGFEVTVERGGEIILYKDNFEVRDLVGRNVIKDEDGVFHVIDANISQEVKEKPEIRFSVDNSSDDIRFRISNENQRIFVSNAEKAVEGIKQEKATPQQWLAMLEKNGGIKAGEDKWLGLSEWLDAQDKKTITKQEILDFISENQIQIEEVAYSAKPKNEVFEQYKQEYRDYYFEAQDNGAEDPQDVAWNRMLEEHGEDFGLGFWAFGSELQVDEDSDYTNWEYENETNERPINETRLDYTTEGLENKREIALTVPTIESWNENDEIHFGDAGEGRAIAWVRFGETSIPNESNPKTKEFLDAEEERKNFSRKMMAKYGLTYTEGDMSMDELQQDLEITKRISQLKDAQEKIKVLVIDEIQSKRHQEGREKGYKGAFDKAALEQAQKESKEYGDYLYEKYIKGKRKGEDFLDYATEEEKAKFRELSDKVAEINKLRYHGIPDAPFDKNWHELAMKRMLRYAAENGFDKVAWTTGAQQAERYDIGSEINVIDVNRDEIDDDIMDVYIYTTKQSRIRLDVSRTTGKVVYVADMYKEFMDKPLSELIGKDLANDIIKSEYEHHRYEGDGLRIGGEGMKGFYDKMLPSFVSKYVKKWGAKVGEVTMPQLQEGYQTMHSVDITPEMKEDVMEGQPMFRISSDKNDVQNVATEIWNKYQYDGELESMRDVAEYAEEHMPKNAQTQALFDAIDAYRIEAEEDRMYYGMRGDLEPFEDAIMDEVERLMNATTQSKLTESEQLTFDALQEVAADAGLDVVEVSEEDAQKVFENNEEPIRTPDGKILGYAQGDTIYLTKAGVTPETMVHEYTHIWAKAMQRKNRAGWENIISIFKQSPLWDVVKNDPNYQGLKSDDAICSEVLARFSGKRGAAQLDEVAREMILEEQQSGSNLGAARVRALINRARTAIKSFWKWVGKNLFGITKFDSMEDVADRVLYDLLNATDLDAQNNEGTAEKSMERPSPEFVEAFNAWKQANPMPEYGEDESYIATAEKIIKWREDAENFKRYLRDKAIQDAKEADPITEPLKDLTIMKPSSDKSFTARDMALEYLAKQNGMAILELVQQTADMINSNTTEYEIIYKRYIDSAAPIEKIEELIKDMGGVVNGSNSVYQDTFAANSRATFALEQEYSKSILRPLSKTMKKMIKVMEKEMKAKGIDIKWQNVDETELKKKKEKINGKSLSAREIIGVYAQAKDTIEAEEMGLPDRGRAGFEELLGMNPEEIVTLVENMISHKRIDTFWKYTRRATNFALQYDYKSGRISEDVYDDNSKRQYYVPERGWRTRDLLGIEYDYKEDSGKTYKSPHNTALIKSHGRNTLAADPFGYIWGIATTSVIASENNKIKQKLLQLVMDNEELGFKSGMFRMKKVYWVNEIDPTTGKVKRDHNGEPSVKIAYSEPSEEWKKHDKEVKEQIKELRKDTTRRKKILEKELAMHGIETTYTKALQRSIDNNEAKIKDLEDTLYIATNLTNSQIYQRTEPEKQQHTVIVLKDGQRYEVELQDVAVANAVNKEFSRHQGELLSAKSALRNATRFMSALMTQYNPEFAIRNFMRDWQVAEWSLAIEHPELFRSFNKNLARCQKAIWKYAANDKIKDINAFDKEMNADSANFFENDKIGKLLKEYIVNGAATGYSFMKDINLLNADFDKMINEGGGKRFWEGVKGCASLFTEVSEMTTRFAAYVAAREKGWTIEDAVFLSKELTTNFDRAGEKANGIMSMYAFMRATINGNIKFARVLKKLPMGVIGIGAGHWILGLVNQLLNPDDPDDEVYVNEYLRKTNFTFGNTTIPVAHFYRMFFASGVNAARAIQGHMTWEEAIFDSAMFVCDELLPAYLNAPGLILRWDYGRNTIKLNNDARSIIQQVALTPIAPFADVYANRNFMGSSIYKRSGENNDNIKAVYLTKEGTLSVYVWLSENIYKLSGGDMDTKYNYDDPMWRTAIFDWSGNTLQHLAEGYGVGIVELIGTTGSIIYDAIQGNDITPDSYPFLRKFYRQYATDRAYQSEFHKLTEATELYSSYLRDLQRRGAYKKLAEEQQSEKYRILESIINNQLLQETANPTDYKVKRLMEANKQWVQARK